MFRKLLIANRGEIALRVTRTAHELGMAVVAVCAQDDAGSAVARSADAVYRLAGRGPAAYLDIEQIVTAALEHGCDAVHPGYGFLSENARFARACGAAGVRFVGPAAEILDLFGDKIRGREFARSCGAPVLEGTSESTDLAAAQAFFEALGPGSAVMIKAVAGGGGRGMRVVSDPADLAQAHARAGSEARRAFGDDAVYLERFLRRARHIEVQIAGDGATVSHLWDRDCTLQRRHQKLVEVAPSPGLPAELREALLATARRMATQCGFDNLGTFEFLVDLDRPGAFAFIEANPRIQVEHTVTEELLGLDLVRIQLELAAGATLDDLCLDQAQVPAPRGYAIQVRVNAETLDAQGQARPSVGAITEIRAPGGPGVRVDSAIQVGDEIDGRFDSLVAKLIVRATGAGFPTALARIRRAAAEFAIEGVETNLPFLRRLLAHPALANGSADTRFIEEHMAELAGAQTAAPALSVDIDGSIPVHAQLAGLVAEMSVRPGDLVAPGAQVAVLEAMKMEHPVAAPVGGIVRAVHAVIGDQLKPGALLVSIEPGEVDAAAAGDAPELDLDHIREDLAEVRRRLEATLDENRPQAVAKRRGRGQRSARENLADLCDPGSFVEYGQLAVAARRRSHSAQELRDLSPADGLVAGLASVNAARFGAGRSQVAVAAYDFTVFSGTQGHANHRKADRLFEIASAQRLPLVLFAEGGGGRPGEDPMSVAHLETPTFRRLAELGGRGPLLGVACGRCFAGNAVLLGLCDIVIATKDSNIGLGGPALIEAAGLGAFKPEQIGPIEVQAANGVVDIRVADEAAAVGAARRCLGYFQGATTDWTADDPRRLRHAIPANRLRAYDVRDVLSLIADADSVLELGADHAPGYVTALTRVEGRPMGVIANNPLHLAGAIEAEGAEKAARFLDLCDAQGLPVLSLIDTPGLMVGPDAEKTALVRRAAQLFRAGARLRSPLFAVVLRKAYGLGAMAAAGGRLTAPMFTVSWPTGEFGGMGLEGAVRLGFKQKLEAIIDPVAREAFFAARLAALYEKGKAANVAAAFELDAVIDPADTRRWLVRGLEIATRA